MKKSTKKIRSYDQLGTRASWVTECDKIFKNKLKKQKIEQILLYTTVMLLTRKKCKLLIAFDARPDVDVKFTVTLYFFFAFADVIHS